MLPKRMRRSTQSGLESLRQEPDAVRAGENMLPNGRHVLSQPPLESVGLLEAEIVRAQVTLQSQRLSARQNILLALILERKSANDQQRHERFSIQKVTLII